MTPDEACDTLFPNEADFPPDKDNEMRDFLQRISNAFRRFMTGRYGSDQLSRFTLMLALVMLVLNMIFRTRTSVFYWLVWVCLIITYFRMFSKNISKRYDENTRFLQLKEKIMGKLRGGRAGKAGDSVRSGRADALPERMLHETGLRIHTGAFGTGSNLRFAHETWLEE